MIRKLTSKDQAKILDFCYLRERENLFVIGSFDNYDDTFAVNKYYGFFEGDELIGLAVFFSRFGNLVINSLEKEVVKNLLDYALDDGVKVECFAVFKRYAEVMIERLDKVYKHSPKKHTEQTVYILQKKDFINFSQGKESQATKEDIDELAIFATEKTKEEITESDRKRVFFDKEFILHADGNIVSRVNIHGVSRKYFQIGGVGTLAKFRGKGYAKQVISFLCQYYFSQGVEQGLLFTANDNVSAQAVYKKIGFKPVDEFIIAEY